MISKKDKVNKKIANLDVTLKKEQFKAVEYSLDRKTTILNCSTSFGKTITSLAILNDPNIYKKVKVFTTPKDSKADKQGLTRWHKEAIDINFNGELEVTTYQKEFNRIKKGKSKSINPRHKTECEYVIFDEVSCIKSSRAIAYKVSKHYSKQATQVVALTATIAPNNYWETVTMMNAVGINVWSIKDEDGFINKFYKTKSIKTPYGFKKVIKTETGTKYDANTALKDNNKDELFELLGKELFMYQVDFEAILGDFHEEVVNIFPNKELSEELDNIDFLEIEGQQATAIQKQHVREQLANGFRYVNYLNEDDMIEKETIIYDTQKIKHLVDILLSNKNDKFIIVYKYIVTKEQIEEVINDNEILKDKLDSGEIVIKHKSVAEAENLQHLNHIIFVSPDFSYEKYKQMKGRIVRYGQKNQIKFSILRFIATVDDTCLAVLNTKEGDSNQLYNYYYNNFLDDELKE